jgi:hypothetical protein
MTQQEARRIVEASTRFEVRGGSVWLREVRWLRAVERQRREEAASALSPAAGAESTAGPRWTPPTPEPDERRSALST